MKQKLKWLFVFLTTLVGACVAYDQGVHHMIMEGDKSNLSWVILGMWLYASLLLGKREFSGEFNENHDIWFFSESFVKVGMMGTIIGIMYSLNDTFTKINPENIETTKEALGIMADGFATALWPTLVGLVTNVSLQFQLTSTET